MNLWTIYWLHPPLTVLYYLWLYLFDFSHSSHHTFVSLCVFQQMSVSTWCCVVSQPFRTKGVGPPHRFPPSDKAPQPRVRLASWCLIPSTIPASTHPPRSLSHCLLFQRVSQRSPPPSLKKTLFYANTTCFYCMNGGWMKGWMHELT